jgi:DNA-binding transcriptional MerR regulator
MNESRLSPPPLENWRIAVTGRLATLSRADLEVLVTELGGSLAVRVDEATTHLLVGERTWPLDREGRLSASLRRALRRRRMGGAVEVLAETEFLRRCRSQAASGIAGPFTLSELSRLTGLPPRTLRHWAACRWLEPVEVVYGIPYYDYRHAAGLRRIAELLAAGVAGRQLALSLRRLERWLPEAAAALVQLVQLTTTGRLAVRLADGRLAEPGGQTLLDFDSEQLTDIRTESSDDRKSVVRYWDGWTFEELTEFAVEWESLGRFAPAAELYQHLLAQRADDAETWFNYGNTLHALARNEEAVAAYRAALTHDATLADAWNNLGAVLDELGRSDEAEAALTEALRLAPDYADARWNLEQLRAERGPAGRRAQ